MTELLLTLAGASVRVAAQTLLEDINLTICHGEKVAVVGANGAGKSSLLRLIAGLLRPSTGSVHLEGREVATLSPRERSRCVSLVPQRMPFIPRFTAREFLELSGLKDVRELDPTVLTLLARFLPDLSGGELQRVVLMSAIAQGARLVLLDEPTAHLDPTGRSGVESVLQRYHRERSLSYLLVTHDISLAARLAERIIVIRQGRVMWDGSVAEAALPAVLEEAYGCPFTKVPHPVTGESLIIPS